MNSRAKAPVSRLFSELLENYRVPHLRHVLAFAPKVGNHKTPSAPPLHFTRTELLRVRSFAALCLLIVLTQRFIPAQTLPAPSPRFTVVIDAAHGGNDSGGSIAGTSGKSQAEKALTLALSVRLRSLLAARGITVVTTRESDMDLDDARRAEIANHAQAQACITLHASMSGSGVHLFLSSLPPVEPARFMPWKTAQAAYVSRSIALAGVLNSSLTHAAMKVTLGSTALNSIDSMTCPAVAVEVAPETKPGGDTTSLDDPGYQARIAEALAAGLLEWRTEPRQP